VCYKPSRKYLKDTYNTSQSKWLEADDLMGIECTKDEEETCIVSTDKDLLTIPGNHWDFETESIFKLSDSNAEKNFYRQALSGDSVDGYPGCLGVGAVTANRVLEEADKKGVSRWDAVRKTYKARGFDEKFAILQARMAYILQKEQFNGIDKYPSLWEPPSKKLIHEPKLWREPKEELPRFSTDEEAGFVDVVPYVDDNTSREELDNVKREKSQKQKKQWRDYVNESLEHPLAKSDDQKNIKKLREQNE